MISCDRKLRHVCYSAPTVKTVGWMNQVDNDVTFINKDMDTRYMGNKGKISFNNPRSRK